MTRCPYDKAVKTHSGYTEKEVAGFVGTHKKAVRERIQKGFPLGDVKRPVPGINKWIVEQIEASRINDHE
jgi:hypothetical protein